jgi:DNA invertase Pin-like site-specific DNA recombinase
VAYIRLGGQQPAREEQARLIAHYCTQHGFRLAKTFVDIGKPSQQLQNALQELEEHDGLIAVDLNSFVEHENDRIRDLRPFIHHFFCHQSKHLITIQEGIDTGSAAGQMAAIEFASQDKDNF